MKRNNLALAMLLLAFAATSGCIFSPKPDPGPINPPAGLPFPDSPDKLMANFQAIYETMDIDEFTKMLHPDYITILQASTTAQYPDVGTTFDLSEELRIHQRMFAGLPVTDPDGAFVPGIASIDFQTFEPQGTWAMSPANDQIPNAEWALYDVIFMFDRGQTYTILKVQGQIKFYVTHRDSLVNGVTKPYYQMLGQMDLTRDQ
jgi:hypothetical protein